MDKTIQQYLSRSHDLPNSDHNIKESQNEFEVVVLRRGPALVDDL